MFDFLRNLTKSDQEKRRERLNAYLDGELSPRERRRFEQELEEDEALRASLDELRWIKLNIQQLPRVRAPRNFTLDPAVYGQRAPAPSWQLYPALRVATALTAFFFVLAVAADLLTPAGALSQPLAQLQAPQVSQVREPEGEADAVGAEEAAEAESMAEPAEVPAEEVVEEPAEEEAAEPMLEAAEAEEETDGTQQEGAAATADDEPAESTASDEAAEESAPEASGPGALAASPQVTPTEDGQRLAAVPTVTAPPAADTDAAADTDTPEPPSPPASFPFLLLAEIILGAALLVLALVTLRARRNR